MKVLTALTVFTGKDAFPYNMSHYEKVVDASMEFPDHIEFVIDFYANGRVVKRLINPSCEMSYE